MQGNHVTREYLLNGVSRAFPALTRTRRVQESANSAHQGHTKTDPGLGRHANLVKRAITKTRKDRKVARCALRGTSAHLQ